MQCNPNIKLPAKPVEHVIDLLIDDFIEDFKIFLAAMHIFFYNAVHIFPLDT
jgi:hypothetical protein